MAEAPQNQILNPEIVRGPETLKPSVDVERAPNNSPVPATKESMVDNTLAADIAASATSLEDTMSIGTPEQIQVVGDSLTAKNIEGWFTSSNEAKK